MPTTGNAYVLQLFTTAGNLTNLRNPFHPDVAANNRLLNVWARSSAKG